MADKKGTQKVQIINSRKHREKKLSGLLELEKEIAGYERGQDMWLRWMAWKNIAVEKLLLIPQRDATTLVKYKSTGTVT